MKRIRVGLFWMALLLAPGLFAQPHGDTKVLLPLVVETPIPGAYGSLWTTRLSIANTGERPITVEGYVQQNCGNACFEFLMTPPGVSFYPALYYYSNEVAGFFLYTQHDDLAFLDVELHAQDLSRQSLTWGTELPVVPETNALTGAVSLGDIPVGEVFRSRLRVYDFDPANNRTTKMTYRVYGVRPTLTTPFTAVGNTTQPAPADELLRTGELTFRVAQEGGGTIFHPGYAELDLGSLLIPTNVTRIRIEIAPATTGLRYWAFVSITNNETQHITTITP